jgi:DNA-binding protein H-NS
MDINTATYDQLKTAREDINVRIRELERAAVAELEARAKQFGFSLLKVNGAPPPSKPKYRGPQGEEWSGKGKRPGWIMQALAEGQSIEDFAV